MTFAVPSEPYEATPTMVHALKQLLILHADHEQNCSTSTVRMVGSSDANLFASVAAGHQRALGPAARRRQPGRARDAAEHPARRRRRRQVREAGQGPRLGIPAVGLRSPRLQELRPPRARPERDRRARHRRARAARRAARHRPAARGGRAHRPVLRRAQALPERRLLLGPHLPRDGLPHEDVHRPVRDGPAPRLDRALEGDDRRARRPRSGAPVRSTPAPPRRGTCRSTSGRRRAPAAHRSVRRRAAARLGAGGARRIVRDRRRRAARSSGAARCRRARRPSRRGHGASTRPRRCSRSGR